MAIRGKPQGGKDRVENWTHDKCPPGEFRVGWLAGDAHVVPCHCSRASLPCLQQLCGRDVSCPGCDKHRPIADLGYVPVYRADGRPMVVVVREHQFDTVGAIRFGSRVRWGRNKGGHETVWIAGETGGPKWESSIEERNRPADLSAWLVRLWRMPELLPALVKWFGAVSVPAPVVVEAPPPPVEDPPPPKWVQGVQDAGAKQHGLEDFASLANRVRDKVSALSNGKHSRPKPK